MPYPPPRYMFTARQRSAARAQDARAARPAVAVRASRRRQIEMKRESARARTRRAASMRVIKSKQLFAERAARRARAARAAAQPARARKNANAGARRARVDMLSWWGLVLSPRARRQREVVKRENAARSAWKCAPAARARTSRAICQRACAARAAQRRARRRAINTAMPHAQHPPIRNVHTCRRSTRHNIRCLIFSGAAPRKRDPPTRQKMIQDII